MWLADGGLELRNLRKIRAGNSGRGAQPPPPPSSPSLMGESNKSEEGGREGGHISLSWFSYRSSIQVELEFENVDFMEAGKPRNPVQNPRIKERTKNKLNPHMTAGLGIEPGPHWYLFPQLWIRAIIKSALFCFPDISI